MPKRWAVGRWRGRGIKGQQEGAQGDGEKLKRLFFFGGAKQTEHCCSYFECSLPLVLNLRQLFWDLVPPDEILGMARSGVTVRLLKIL